MALERWRRKMVESGEMLAPAIVIVEKGSLRGLTKEEIRQGLDESKEQGQPAVLQWNYDE